MKINRVHTVSTTTSNGREEEVKNRLKNLSKTLSEENHGSLFSLCSIDHTKQICHIKIKLNKFPPFLRNKEEANKNLGPQLKSIFERISNQFHMRVVVEELDVSCNQISGRGLLTSHLRNTMIKDITRLNLSKTQVSSRFVNHLNCFESLEEVDFSYCPNMTSLTLNPEITIPSIKKIRAIFLGKEIDEPLVKLERKFPNFKVIDLTFDNYKKDDHGVIETHLDIVNTTSCVTLSEGLNFVPITGLDFIDNKNFEMFKKEWNSLVPSPTNMKVHFDNSNNKVYLGYSDKEIFNLLRINDSWSEFVRKYVGGPSRNIFNGYINSHCYGEEYLMTNRVLEPLSVNDLESALIHKSKMFFKKFKSTSLNIPTGIKINDPKEIYDDVYNKKRFEGLIIGEYHHQHLPKKMIIDHMEELKNIGVKTIFLEFLSYDTLQDELDHYFNNPANEMPVAVQGYLNYLDKGFGLKRKQWGYYDLVVAAKKAGIRVVGIDNRISNKCGFDVKFGSSGYERIASMNYVAEEVIKREKGSGKYIVLTGRFHAYESKGVPGLTSILGCPGVVVTNEDEVFNDSDSLPFHYII